MLCRLRPDRRPPQHLSSDYRISHKGSDDLARMPALLVKNGSVSA